MGTDDVKTDNNVEKNSNQAMNDETIYDTTDENPMNNEIESGERNVSINDDNRNETMVNDDAKADDETKEDNLTVNTETINIDDAVANNEAVNDETIDDTNEERTINGIIESDRRTTCIHINDYMIHIFLTLILFFQLGNQDGNIPV